MKRALIAALAVCAFAVSGTVATATPPTDASGDWWYVPVEVEFGKVTGQRVFFGGTTLDTFEGTFEGTGVQEFIGVHHVKQSFNFYKGVTEFTGTVEDESGVRHEGTMTILTVGKQDPGLLDPSDLPWNGTWVIVGGTDGLEHLHGHGTFTGPSLHLTYDGEIHFEG
jgi:hypothetical protein